MKKGSNNNQDNRGGRGRGGEGGLTSFWKFAQSSVAVLQVISPFGDQSFQRVRLLAKEIETNKQKKVLTGLSLSSSLYSFRVSPVMNMQDLKVSYML